MSVTAYTESYMDRSGSFGEVPDESRGRFDSEYTRNFYITTNSASDDAGTIKAWIQAGGGGVVPWLWTTHPNDTQAIVKSIDVNPREGQQTQWDVTVKYRAKRGDEAASSNPIPQDPTDLPARISYGSGTRYSRVADKAYDAGISQDSSGDWSLSSSYENKATPTQPIENSAEQPFDPPLMVDEAMLQINISRAEAYSSSLPDDIEIFKDSVNSADITVAGVAIKAFQGRIVDITATKRWMDDGTRYFDMTYVIEVDRRGHVRQVLDRGFFQLESNGSHSKLTDTDGDAMTEPLKLDGAGGKLAAGSPPVYLGFLTSYPISWSSLNLPTSA